MMTQTVKGWFGAKKGKDDPKDPEVQKANPMNAETGGQVIKKHNEDLKNLMMETADQPAAPVVPQVKDKKKK